MATDVIKMTAFDKAWKVTKEDVNSLLISHIDSVIFDVESGESGARIADTLRQIRMGLIQGEYNE
tara:strand:+ start:314 stop:508 length:195 start_codon:yes stop_codon:yes gene_type:complete